MATTRIKLPFGLEEQPGRKIERDYFGVMTIDTSFACVWENMVRLMPAPLSAYPDFPFAKLTAVNGGEEEGEQAIISVTYRGLEATESVHKLSLVPCTQDDPIETHKRYGPHLSQEEYKYIADYLDTPKKFVSAFDLSSLGLELLGKRVRGAEAYINQGITLRDTFYRQADFPAIRSIAITSAPAGAPAAPSGCTWLFIPGEGEQDGGCVKIVDEYRLSGPLGWDTDLYAT